MQMNIAKEVATLRRLTTGQLRQRYAEAFGDSTNASNRAWLVRRIAWRLQAKAEGDLSERARRRAAELANDADLRMNPPVAKDAGPEAERTVTEVLPLRADNRLPPTGSVITRTYKGEALQVRVLDGGCFDFEGETFASLSAVAKKITGQHMNGYLFFRLSKEAV
jgi:hypothetical protein